MEKSFLEGLETDYKITLERVFDKIYRSVQECEITDLPNLKMEFMVDDYDDYITVQKVLENVSKK